MTVPSLIAIGPWEFLAIIAVLTFLATSGNLPELTLKFGQTDINEIDKLFPRVLVALAVVLLIVLLLSCFVR